MSIGGLDVGTNVCRLIAFSESGKQIASAYREYSLISASGSLEIDPSRLWRSVVEVCKDIAAKTTTDPVEAIGVSAMGDTLIPARLNFSPAGNAILAFDTRSAKQCDYLAEQLGFEEIHRVTGMPAHSMNTATKILWMVEARKTGGSVPDRFMCAEDFVIANLTGRAAMSLSTAGRTMMFDNSSRRWWAKIVDCIGIRQESLSDVVESGTVVDRISPHVAGEMGFSRSPLIVTAGHDQICSAIGCGATRDGVVCDNTGTFECIIVGVEERKRHGIDLAQLARNNLAFFHGAPRGLWAAFAWFNAGSVIKWCRDTLFSLEKERSRLEKRDVYEEMFQGLSPESSSIRFLPHFTGTGTPWLDSKGKGVLIGLDLRSSRSDILRAALEGIGYDLMLNFECFAQAGIAISEIRATGGGSRSPFWLQLKADMTGNKVIAVKEPEASALGAAICAASAANEFQSISEAAQGMVTLGRSYEPNEDKGKRYKHQMELHRNLYNIIALNKDQW